MNNDGWGFLGAGTSDDRLAGTDLQHNVQRTADEAPNPRRAVRQQAQQGGPMKENLTRMLEQEAARHKEGKKMRMEHLESHYKR